MTSSMQFTTGRALAVLFLPVLLTVGGCLPTSPMLGDPEKSRVDPNLSGLWVWSDSDVLGVVLFETFDKRTWLITFAGFEFDDQACGTEDPVDDLGDTATESAPEGGSDSEIIVDVETESPYDALLGLIATHGVDCFNASGEVLAFKAWRTEIARQAFMTWEPKGTYSEDYGFAPVDWTNFRIDTPDANTLSLATVDFSYAGFEDNEALERLGDEEPPFDPRTLKAATRAAERIIRKNIDDEDLYEESMVFHRPAPEDIAFFADILNESWGW